MSAVTMRPVTVTDDPDAPSTLCYAISSNRDHVRCLRDVAHEGPHLAIAKRRHKMTNSVPTYYWTETLAVMWENEP